MDGASILDSDGTLYFGSQNGTCYFDPSSLFAAQIIAPVTITRFFVYSKQTESKDVETPLPLASGRITLPYNENTFKVSFNVLDYTQNSQVEFAYMMEGLEDVWYNTQGEKQVTFRNIPPGKYTFKVRTRFRNQEWEEKIATLPIIIRPPFWLAWYAKLLYFFTAATLIYILISFYKRKLDLESSLKVERKNNQNKQELNDERLRFYTNITHELRTPLTLILGPLEDLLSDNSLSPKHANKISIIHDSAARLLNLINGILEFRKTETQNRKLSVARGDLSELVQEIGLRYKELNRNPKVNFHVHINTEETLLFYDADMLTTILNNLLSNAFKYTESGQSITVTLKEENGWLLLQVSDTGIGIPINKQGKIFERFYQIENGREGSGIGLSLVQRLVELHHGRIVLQSEVGKGSTFTIYLPQDESVYTQEELLGRSGDEGEQRVYSTNANDIYIGDDEKFGEEVSTDEENCKRGTILVVEDNRELRQYLVNGLSALFDILETENGQKALDILKDKDVDLIITDVMMPVMDGVRLCKLVKQNLRTCHIPVYMLSAKVDIKYQLEGLQVGADDYIAKPFSMEVLRTKILNMLRTRYRIFERYSNMTEIRPEKLTSNTMDEELLRKAIAVVEKNMDNVEFSTEQFAREMNMSRSNLHLKLKAITGKSAIDFIHKIRFNRACQLLKEGKYTVSEISFMVGYNTPSYFAARFKKYIGCLPTEYGKK